MNAGRNFIHLQGTFIISSTGNLSAQLGIKKADVVEKPAETL
jgi:hypothetical protein